MKKIFEIYEIKEPEKFKKYINLLKEYCINHVVDHNKILFPSEIDKKMFELLLKKKK